MYMLLPFLSSLIDGALTIEDFLMVGGLMPTRSQCWLMGESSAHPYSIGGLGTSSRWGPQSQREPALALQVGWVYVPAYIIPALW